MSNVENKIINSHFSYEEPWFYNNNLSIRCELGIGKDEKYIKNAKNRAREIAGILFENGIDCFFFNHYYYDIDTYKDQKITKKDIKTILNYEKEKILFCLSMQNKYRHLTIKKIDTTEDDEELIQINRIICYPESDFKIKDYVSKRVESKVNPIVHFVSFTNECILSIYDDRGCDIIFFDEEKFVKFYPFLEKYFLDFDKETIQKRYKSLVK